MECFLSRTCQGSLRVLGFVTSIPLGVFPDLYHHLSNKASHQAVLTILDLILDMPCQRLDSKQGWHLMDSGWTACGA